MVEFALRVWLEDDVCEVPVQPRKQPQIFALCCFIQHVYFYSFLFQTKIKVKEEVEVFLLLF